MNCVIRWQTNNMGGSFAQIHIHTDWGADWRLRERLTDRAGIGGWSGGPLSVYETCQALDRPFETADSWVRETAR